MASKFSWTENEAPTPIKQEDLKCKDCLHRGGRTDICAIYQQVKPTSILRGGGCKFYKLDKSN
jgi:hypothetical protein